MITHYTIYTDTFAEKAKYFKLIMVLEVVINENVPTDLWVTPEENSLEILYWDAVQGRIQIKPN